MIPYKVLIILREDILYSYERIFKIGVDATLLIENDENFGEWRVQGGKVENYMVFNLHFQDILENELISSGIKYQILNNNKTPVGIVIHPTVEYLKGSILKSSLTLSEYSKHRLTLFNEEIK